MFKALIEVVINTSVLLALGKLGYLRLIRKLFDKLVIAESVFRRLEAAKCLCR
jgi:predicted nucleic acid-binding protein